MFESGKPVLQLWQHKPQSVKIGHIGKRGTQRENCEHYSKSPFDHACISTRVNFNSKVY